MGMQDLLAQSRVQGAIWTGILSSPAAWPLFIDFTAVATSLFLTGRKFPTSVIGKPVYKSASQAKGLLKIPWLFSLYRLCFCYFAIPILDCIPSIFARKEFPSCRFETYSVFQYCLNCCNFRCTGVGRPTFGYQCRDHGQYYPAHGLWGDIFRLFSIRLLVSCDNFDSHFFCFSPIASGD